MISKLAGAVVIALVLSLVGMAPAHAYTPPPGAAFNDPGGTRAEQNGLAVRVRETIESVPRGGIIRMAIYSFDRADIADALIAACGRHVSVQIVLNDNWTSAPTRRMRSLMGTDIDPRWDDACHPRSGPRNRGARRTPHPVPSFVKICDSACRGGAGNQHMKFFAFSQAGSASNVIMTGSVNLTEYAASTHWNDMYTVVEKPAMFEAYGAMLRELAEDTRVLQRYRVMTDGDFVTEFGARSLTTRTNDPVKQRLDKVQCRTGSGYGASGRTVIRIAMYAWVGRRGRFLADKVADLDRRGCEVRVLLSGAARGVKRILRNGGVSMRSADLDLDGDPESGFGETAWERFTHEKWMALNGHWDGRDQRIVWTGSENWSDKSLINDEVTLQIPKTGAHRAYAQHFDYLWDHRTRAF
ncbi:MAG: phospholipase D-like domain-containing protein [Nocardioides sp.]